MRAGAVRAGVEVVRRPLVLRDTASDVTVSGARGSTWCVGRAPTGHLTNQDPVEDSIVSLSTTRRSGSGRHPPGRPLFQELLCARQLHGVRTRCVTEIGPTGYFTANRLEPPAVLPEPPGYDGAPDGRIIPPVDLRYPYPLFDFTDINSTGVAVGARSEVPIVYREGGTIDINRFLVGDGSWMARAAAINDIGYVVASGYDHGALLVPMRPEPPSGAAFTVTDRTVRLFWREAAGALDYIVEAGSTPV